MRTLILTLSLLHLSIFGFAQNQFTSDKGYIDSLKHALTIVRHDTSRSLILAQITDSYKFNRPDSAIYYGNRALLLARQLKFTKGELKAMLPMILAYGRLGNSSKGLKICLDVIKIVEKNNLTDELAPQLFLLGNFYSANKDYTKSLPLYRRAKILSDATNNKTWSTMSQAAIGANYMSLNQLDSASYYLLLAYENAVNLKQNWVINNTVIKLIRLEKTKGDNVKALHYFNQMISPDKDFNINTQLNLLLSDIYKALNKPDSCVYFINKSLDLAQESGNISKIIDASVAFSNFYEKSNPPLALKYSQQAITYKDSLSSLINRTAIESFTNFDEQERQYEIDTATTAYRNRIAFFALLAGLAVFSFIAFILYRNNQKEKKAKTLLQEQKDKVDKTLTQLKATQAQLIQSEKLASLGELTAGIAHEIQNPLNFVNNFSELSVDLANELNEEIKNSPLTPDGGIIIKDKEYIEEIISDLTQNQEKINLHGKRASSIVKGMLEHSRASTGEKELTDINKLADESLRLSYHGLRAKNKGFNSDFKTDFDKNIPKINVIPQDIGRVLLNLINNAFYAVSSDASASLNDRSHRENYKPKVTVSTRYLSEVESIELRVKDNGTGISEATKAKIFQPFFTTKPTGQGTGLGLSLAYDIITKGHGGTIECESIEGEGTTFIVKLPLNLNNKI